MTEDTDGDDGRRKGTLAKLLDLLAEMEARGERTRSGRWTGDRLDVDYSISTGSLEDFGDRGRFDPDSLGSGPDSDSDSGSGPGSDSGDAQASAPNVTTRETETGVLVVADLPGVDAADVSLGIDRARNVFTLEVENEVVGRVPVDDGEWVVADASFTNGILEVHLRDE